jgi:hypothetical protein
MYQTPAGDEINNDDDDDAFTRAVRACRRRTERVLRQ